MSRSGAAFLTPGKAFPAFNRAGYIFTLPVAGTTTSNQLNNGSLRAVPWVVDRALSVSRLGGETTAAGDAGSTLRIGVYTDDGTGNAQSLVAGSECIIPTDVVAVSEAVVNFTLTPGLYWVASVLQGVTVTQPTFRVNSANVGFSLAAASIPGAGAAFQSYNMTGVTAALPATYAQIGLSGFSPRTFAKVA